MNKMFKKSIKILLILVLVGFSTKIYIEVYLLKLYTNNYITLDVYNNSKLFLSEISNKIILKDKSIGKYILNNCIYFNSKKTEYKCIISFKPNKDLESDLFKLGIQSIEIEESSFNTDKVINYYVNKNLYSVKQVSNPVIVHSPNSKFGGFSRYLPFPISNNFFYIGRLTLVKDEYWLISSKNGDFGE